MFCEISQAITDSGFSKKPVEQLQAEWPVQIVGEGNQPTVAHAFLKDGLDFEMIQFAGDEPVALLRSIATGLLFGAIKLYLDETQEDIQGNAYENPQAAIGYVINDSKESAYGGQSQHLMTHMADLVCENDMSYMLSKHALIEEGSDENPFAIIAEKIIAMAEEETRYWIDMEM